MEQNSTLHSEAAENAFLRDISGLLQQSRNSVRAAVNISMVYTYYEIGRRIVQEEQKGKNRANYGAYLIGKLASYLSKQMGKGFSVTNLKQMRQFYVVYSTDQISQIPSDQFKNRPEAAYYDRMVKLPDENPTIGIILCKDKNQSVVEMTLPKNNSQIFASKYKTVLPQKEELQQLLNEQK